MDENLECMLMFYADVSLETNTLGISKWCSVEMNAKQEALSFASGGSLKEEGWSGRKHFVGNANALVMMTMIMLEKYGW